LRQLSEWEKSLPVILLTITRIHRELKTLRIHNSTNKWENELNRQLSKEEVQMANKHRKTCPTPLPIKEMQTKMTL
jgi:hypothetical protein